MEGVVALGVAGNVVQFLDFASKLCSTSLEIYRTVDGASTSNAQTEALLKGFIESVDEVSSDLAQYRNALLVTSRRVVSSGPGQIGSIIADCQVLAEDLVNRFENLKIGGTPGRWRSFVAGVKCMWKKKELDELQQRLQQHRAELEWRILISLRENVNLLTSRQHDQFQALQTAMTTKLTEAIRNEISSLPRWPQFVEDTQQKLRSEAISARASKYKQPEKSALRNKESTSHSQSAPDPHSFVDEYAQEYVAKLAEVEEALWESLSFRVMYDREDQISDAELRTFEWILKKPGNKQPPWSDFLEWLEKGKGIYWINGKAGSGKSTLMKYLNANHKLMDTLQAWSGEIPLVTASFFFWYNGNDLQKTQVGLLRALLYQALKDHRERIPHVLSDAAEVATGDLLYFWTLPRVTSAFKKLMEQKDIPLKICLFVDGLDEYTGDHLELVQLFRDVSNFENIKLCVSSRPLLVFDRAFKGFPGLVLQNLTFDDIRTYVRNRFSADERFRELEIEEPSLGPNLAFEVVNKASGVFLWVKLVVHSLLEGLGNYDRGVDLERRLSELPEDLDDLYWHILDRVKPAWYLEEGFRFMLLVHAAVVPLNLLQLSFADTGEGNLAIECTVDDADPGRQQALCKGVAGRIKSRCLGLLEVTDMAHKDMKYRRVQFLHKSVRDFIETPRMRNRMKESLAGKDLLVPEIAIMKSLLMELKTVRSWLGKEQSLREAGISRESWFDEVRPIVFEIVRYGQVTDSRHPGISHMYSSLVTQADDIASDLWRLVSFKSHKERSGEVHWCIAPRKPGGASVLEDTLIFLAELLVDLIDVADDASSRADSDYEEIEVGQSWITEASSPFVNSPLPPQPVSFRRVRFGEIGEPKRFPGEDDEMERPPRTWPCDRPHNPSPFRLDTIDFVNTSCGFEAFVRALGLEKYADERFKSTVVLKKSDNPMKVRAQSAITSFKSRLKSLWKRPR